MAQRASRVEPRMIRPMHFGNAWDFLCRALSESKLKAQLELSANDTCALKEDKLKAKCEFSAAGICRILSESKLKAQLELSAAGNMQINISKNKGG